jgi:shikimate dehydrogenase
MRLFGLIGYPLEHSFSGVLFKDMFAKEGITDAVFALFEMETLEALPTFILEHPHLNGFTVTIPYKTAILPYLDEITEEAAEIGAVNVVKIQRDTHSIKLVGYNTDVVGFEKSLRKQLQPCHTPALVLGTGGAGKAVGFVLKKLKIPYRYVSHKGKGTVFSYDSLSKETIDACPLLVNATPIGMYPAVDTAPELPYEAMSKKHFLFDLVYNPSQTLFLKKGSEQGALTQNGYDMLCYQAQEAWKIWNE